VTVSNSLGSVTSRVARLTGVCVFTVQPQAQTTGLAPRWCWLRRCDLPCRCVSMAVNGVNLAGATNTTLELTHVGLEAAEPIPWW